MLFANGKPGETPLAGDFWATGDDKNYAAHVYAAYVESPWKAARSAIGPLVGTVFLM